MVNFLTSIVLFSPHAMGTCLVTHIPQNILFCVQQNKEIHIGMEQNESE